MSSPNLAKHDLYHEARRGASLARPIQRYSDEASLLLLAPNNIIFELFGTVVKKIPAERLLSFITDSLMEYLEQNWENKITQQIFKRLKREQAVDIRAGLKSIPLIKYSTAASSSRNIGQQRSATKESEGASRSQSRDSTSSSTTSTNQSAQKSPPLSYTTSDSKHKAARQIYEHVMWRIRTENVTQITSLLVKLALDDGYKRARLKAEIFEDIPKNFELWRSQLLIKLYAFGEAPANDQKLILSSTNRGDLTKWLANYIDGSEKRQNIDLIRKLASALRDRTNNCVYLTHDLPDAIRSLQTNSIRLVLLVDRTKKYDPISAIEGFKSTVEPLISGGKLFIISSLDCVKFAPDPTNETCC